MYANLITLPCFAGVNRGCSRALSLKIKRAYFGPGELILKEGDVINAIFFVNSGTIEIVQKDCIVAILGKFSKLCGFSVENASILTKNYEYPCSRTYPCCCISKYCNLRTLPLL